MLVVGDGPAFDCVRLKLNDHSLSVISKVGIRVLLIYSSSCNCNTVMFLCWTPSQNFLPETHPNHFSFIHAGSVQLRKWRSCEI